jgi:isocitrate/isopropylmalate dehydrogenase
MARHKIAVLPGDGIGRDVMDAAMLVLDELGLDADYIHGDVGWEFWTKEGNPLPDRTLELLKNTDACLFGAITSKPKQEAESELDPSLRDQGYSYYSPIVRIRQELSLSTNLRPCFAFEGNPLNHRDDIDLVVFRENTEGLYSGVEFHPVPQEVLDALLGTHARMRRFGSVPLDEMAISLRIFTVAACRKILRAAFKHAKTHGYRSVTVVEKPNVIRETSGMMVREAREMAPQYPEVQLWETNVDAMCMWLVKNPQDYGVLVSSNMFGDIISDLCAQLVGGLGFASSGNIGSAYALFEPTHGSAPKYAGQNKVNPMAMLLATRLMLDWLGETKKAHALLGAIAKVVREAKVRTYDMGGTAGTMDVAREVTEKLGA